MWWSSVRIWPSRPFFISGIQIIKSLSSFHFFIPLLFQPLEIWKKDFQFTPISPNLSWLLRKFEVINSHNVSGIDASLFASIGFNQNNELPIAYYQSLTQQKTYKNRRGGILIGIDHQKIAAGEQTILCADPAHLEVGLNDITLTQQITDLTEEETKFCIDALNQHFKQDGLKFLAVTNHQWYLLINSKMSIKTVALSEVLRKNVAHHQPVSESLNWKTIQNETQMILHSMPLNQKREDKGLPTLNSLWFFGAGKPENFRHNFDAVWSKETINAKMISAAADIQLKPLPNSPLDILKHVLNNKNKTTNNQVIFDQLMMPAIYEDIDEYQHQLSKLDDYISPFIESWKKGEINLIIDDCSGKLLKPHKVPAWQFWGNKPPPLVQLSKVIK